MNEKTDPLLLERLNRLEAYDEKRRADLWYLVEIVEMLERFSGYLASMNRGVRDLAEDALSVHEYLRQLQTQNPAPEARIAVEFATRALQDLAQLGEQLQAMQRKISKLL
jgi:hypothetical protein